ncbi:capsule biosynthesis protein [Campylobacter sp. MIT 99-7217]|uniref:capsule biosynthesis protein n=1 Tax=Campylobacter sp. MIT 99-7217 TaxID=535091 RepID=UPI00163C6C11|nr:capsule biosynthesis protein [Campylobacter sp. MIT 99-7217]
MLGSFKAVIFFMILVVIYYTFIAADRFVSETAVTVKSSEQSSGIAISGLGSLLGGSSLSSNDDVNYLRTYILSPDMLRVLEKEINIRQIYEAQKLDFFFSLSPSANEDKFVRYYKDRIKITEDNALLNIQVEGFTPEQARLIAGAILKESERFINELSHKSAREDLNFAESELIKYKEKYQEASNKLIVFQNEHGVFDPSQEAKGRSSFLTEMESKIATKEAELLAMQSYIQDNAPQLSILKAEIKALKAQLEKEKAQIISLNEQTQKLNNLAADFESLKIEVGFAQSAYEAALKAYETTRIETIRKIKHLVIVQAPTLPQSAEYPKKIYNIITIFVVLSLVFGVLKLIRTIIEEHKY